MIVAEGRVPRQPRLQQHQQQQFLDKKLRERHLRQRKKGWRRGWSRCSGHHQHLPLGQSIFHATIGVSCVLSVLPATEKFGMPSVQTVTVKKEKSSRNRKIVKGSRFHAVPRKVSPMWADDYLSNHQLFHKLFHFLFRIVILM